MGRGPEHLLQDLLHNGLAGASSDSGHDLEVRVLEAESSPPAEVSVAFELDRLIAGEVRGSRRSGDIPLVLSGNCNNSVGTVAGLGDGVGVVWLDGHADFQTPETTRTGFSDNMGLSIIAGHCWKNMVAGVPDFSPVLEENMILAGAREIEPEERERLANSEISVFEAKTLDSASGREDLELALEEMGERGRGVYLHLDLDVLDPEAVGRANEFALSSGLAVEEVERMITITREHCELSAVGVASYDPAFDHGGAVLRAGLRLIRAALV